MFKNIIFISFLLLIVSFQAKAEQVPAELKVDAIVYPCGYGKFCHTDEGVKSYWESLPGFFCNQVSVPNCRHTNCEVIPTDDRVGANNPYGGYSCEVRYTTNDGRDVLHSINFWGKRKLNFYECPSTHPIEIDTDGDGQPNLCEDYTCDCDEDNIDGVCTARTVTWNGDKLSDIVTGALVETSNANNQGRQCGRVIPDSSCSPESPIQNKDEMGNPISCASGQKIQSEVDYQSSVGNLRFDRTYIQEPEQVDSGMSNVAFDRSILPSNVQMVYSYSSRIAVGNYNFWSPNVPQLEKSGSRVAAFTNGRGGRKVFLDNAAFRGQQGSLTETGSTTIHTTVGGTEYHFNSENKLIKKVYRNGQFQDYTYPSADQLVITDNFGRSLTIDYVTLNLPYYGFKQFVSKLTDPAGNEYLYQYDSLGQLIKVTYPDETPNDASDNPFKQYGYQDLGNNHQGLTSITDELGANFAQWSYDSYRRATLSEHSGSAEKVTIDYTNPTSEVASSSVKHYRDATNYTETLYDFKKLNGSYKPLKISIQPCPNCSVGETLYAYDASGYLSQVTHPDGTITRYQYNSKGQQLGRTEAFGTAQARTITTSWHSQYNLPLSVDEPQRVTTYAYDAKGNLLSRSVKDKTTNETRTVSYTYNQWGQVLTVDGARTDLSDITTYEYAANGNLTKVTNALGHQTLITAHDAHGKPLSVTDPNGTVTSMTYHPRGWLTSITTDGDTTHYAYDKAGQLKTVTLPNGVALRYEYDAAQRLTAIVDGQGNRIEYALDYMGNRTRTEIRDASGTLKSFATAVFNDLGRLKQTLGANNQSNQVDYDAAGKPTQTTDALNNPTASHYDALDRVIKVVDPAQGETQMGYDSHDRLTSVTDATQKTTSYQYNAFGDLIGQTSPDTGAAHFSYDSAGNLISATDARGMTVTYAYDALNRLLSIGYPNAAENVNFSYDSTANNNKGIGRLTQITDESGSTSYQYDAKGQLTAERRLINGISFVTAYQYDAAGLLTQITYPSGRVVAYARNNLGQITQVTTSANGQSQILASNISYLPFGPMQSLTYGNGKVLTQNHDQDYRLTQKSVNGVTDFAYGYTARNNINSIISAINSAHNQSYQYDALGRLTNATGNYGNQSYSFDGIGNRLTKTQDGATTNYQYDSNSHRLTQFGDTNLSYDAIGNTLTKGDLTFSYNQAGRMISASKTGMNASYQYNAQGQRVKKTVDGQTSLYHYDQAGQLIAQTDGQGNLKQEYIYLDGQRLATLDNGATYYVHSNHLDAPIALTDQAGAIQWQGYYDPYGNLTVNIDNVSQPMRFPGQIYDQETGLLQNYFRDLDTEIGRYIQSDPIGLNGGINTYGYVGGNPVNATDPLGLFITSCTASPQAIALCSGAVGATTYAVGGAVATYKPGSIPNPVSAICDWMEGDESDDPLSIVEPIPQNTLPMSTPVPPGWEPEDGNGGKDGSSPRKIDAHWGVSNYKHGGRMSTIEHINYRHAHNSGFRNVSRFSKETSVKDIRKYVDTALRNGNVQANGTNGFMIEYNLGRTIGTNRYGNPATNIRIYVQNGTIRTAFPF